MILFNIENLSKSYTEKTLIENISFGIMDKDKIGLIGINGTGKTTLLKLIAGIEKPVCSEVNNEEIPSFIFIDQKDASKKVEVDLDPATGKLYSLFVQ